MTCDETTYQELLKNAVASVVRELRQSGCEINHSQVAMLEDQIDRFLVDENIARIGE